MCSIIFNIILILLTSTASAQERSKTAQEVSKESLKKTSQERVEGAQTSEASRETSSSENSHEALIKQILSIAKILESRDEEVIKNFILTYAIPKEMRDIMSDRKIETITQEFIKTKQDKMRKVLLLLPSLKSTKGPNGLNYTFRIDQSKQTFYKDKVEFKYSEKYRLSL